MSIIDLRELAKSLMFAEKAKEEAEELRRDNEHLYKVNAEYGERYSKDRAIISHLENEHKKIILHNDALIRERDVLYSINKNLVAELKDIYTTQSKCIVMGCTNDRHDGKFVGNLCSPCHEFLTTGKGTHSQVYRNVSADTSRKPLTDAEIELLTVPKHIVRLIESAHGIGGEE